eukprot:TRINITY_DN6576_c0_g1_i4.p1 TRINITY_DN6576_c0_g1~~TRINITY_DN6576_c0_g1_i4.p1  ORF type:complete len:1003 (+),score=223.32 TRINITY_DN6576_c0_g1_i4:478-3486(+)
MGVWLVDSYYIYGSVILLISFISVLVTLHETKANIRRLREMSHFETRVTVMRAENEGEAPTKLEISSRDLVPGDLFLVAENDLVPCDAVLVEGTAVMNEAMLTGESVPVFKNPLPPTREPFDLDDDRAFLLLCGTKCLQARSVGTSPALAIALRTGFDTAKGRLVRGILYPRENPFKFYSDALKFLAVLFLIAVVGFGASLPVLVQHGVALFYIIIKSLEVITVAVPPGLPAILGVGSSISLARLVAKRIYCTSPPRIAVSGKVNVIAFDKTGTLTQEGLDVFGLRFSYQNMTDERPRFYGLIQDIRVLNQHLPRDDGAWLSKTPARLAVEAMATCHALTRIAGETVGDVLDVKMLEASGWTLAETETGGSDRLFLATVRNSAQPNEELALIRRFEFSSKLQRMSVVVRNGSVSEEEFCLYAKGAPEKIRELCKQESIPDDFHTVLQEYTHAGHRVLALAIRPIRTSYRKILAVRREDVERELVFLGFLIMANRLKEETKAAICALNDAHIRTLMVTGDNALTAISVGRQCGIVRAEQTIFLGEVSESKIGGRATIEWKDFDCFANELNPDTLVPVDRGLSFTYSFLEANHSPLRKHYGANDLSLEVNEVHTTPPAEEREVGGEAATETSPESAGDDLGEILSDAPWLECSKSDYVLCVTGRVFAALLHLKESNPNSKAAEVFDKMLEKCQIYARMHPQQKAQMIAAHQARESIVAMCGDGANDCSALRKADIGLSLSEAEASVAAAFTSKIANISCMVQLLREGRASLVSSFQCFKYTALYSMIQFTSVILLYICASDLTDPQYIYIDLFIVFPLSVLMNYTGPHSTLAKDQPTSSLFSVSVMSSVIGHVILVAIFQVLALWALFQQSWYVSCEELNPESLNVDNAVPCYENATLFLFSNFQYLGCLFVFNTSKPFRKPFYTNFLFTILSFIMVSLSVLISLWNSDFILGFLDLKAMEAQWRQKLLLASVLYFVVAIAYEKVVVRGLNSFWRKLKMRLRER